MVILAMRGLGVVAKVLDRRKGDVDGEEDREVLGREVRGSGRGRRRKKDIFGRWMGSIGKAVGFGLTMLCGLGGV